MIVGEHRQGGNQSKDGHEDELDAWMRLVPDVCLLTDEAGMIEAANGPAAEMLRVPQDALAGRSILDFVESSADGDGKLRARIAALEEGEQLVEDVMLRCDKRDLVAARLRVLRSSRNGRAMFHWLMRGDVHEQALRESEQEQRQLTRSLDLERRRLAALLENLPVGVWVSDEQGRLIEKNKEADAIWAGDAPLAEGMDEYTQYVARDAATGKVLAPEEYPTAQVLATGRRVGPVEVDIRRFDGTEGTVLVSVVPIEDEQGKLVGTVGINVDITARKRGEAALRESEQRFSVVFAKAPFAINLARLEDGTVVEVNEAWEALTGFTREEAIDKTSVELGLKPNPEMRARVMSAVQTGRPVRKVEMPFTTRSGMSRVVSVSVDVVKVGGVEYLLAVQEDITERIKTREALQKAHDELEARVVERTRELQHAYDELQNVEEELRLQNEELRVQNEVMEELQLRYQALFDLAPDGYLVTDASGTILEANRAAADLLGVRAEELHGTRLDAHVFHADGEIYGRHLHTIRTEQGALTLRWEMRIERQEGVLVDAAVAATASPAGEVKGIRWLLRDVTREKQIQAALVQAERLAMAGQLAASLAHEINNPLAAAMGSIELVREAAQDGDEIDPLLSVMYASLARASRLVTQLRDVEPHTRAEKKRPADLNRLVENVLLLAGKKARSAGVEISWHPNRDVPPLSVASDGLQQVLLNLVLNAVEAMQGGGRLAVRIRRAQQPPRVGIEFADSGPGVAPEMRSRLFEPFETTKEGGSGLGLFVSQSIVQQHGGSIEVKSTDDEGATFTVWLPAPRY
jgi:PAS domain S-box-containing protein